MAKKGAKLHTTYQRGVIYARYSSHAQRDCSIEQQIDAAMDYATRNGIQIIRIYSDHAVSGRTDTRPQYQKLMRDAETIGDFDVVVSWKSNRLDRNMVNALTNEERLKKAGVRCVYVEERYDDNATGRFLHRFMMNLNQYYSENMGEDIRRGLRDSAAKGVAIGQMPFGYKKDPETKKYAIDEERAEIVREVFSRVAKGEPHIDIVDDLNRRGIKSATGKAISRTSFQYMLRNDKYIGVYRYHDQETPDVVPRIISDELFYKVQEVLMSKPNPRNNTKRRTKNGSYLLTGKLFCGRCGNTMTGISGTGRHGEPHFYYVCNGKRLHLGCTRKNIQRNQIEQEVGKAIRDFALTDEVVDWIGDAAMDYCREMEKESNLHLFERELADNEKALANIMKAIENGMMGDTISRRLRELEAENKSINRKIQSAKRELVTVSKEEVVAALKMYRDGRLDDRKYLGDLIDTFVHAVYVYEDEIKVVFNYSGDKSATVPLAQIEEAIKNEPLEEGVRLRGTEWTYRALKQTRKPRRPHPVRRKSMYMARGLFVIVCPFPPSE